MIQERDKSLIQKLLTGFYQDGEHPQQAIDRARRILDEESSAELSWANFCLHPDLIDPVRMPTMFPISTHIYKVRDVQTVSVGDTNYSTIWQPEVAHGVGRLASLQQGTDDNTVSGNRAGFHVYVADEKVNHGGVRLIGAYLEIEYMGKVDDIQGIIEVGLHLNSHSPVTEMTTTTTFEDAILKLGQPHYPTESEIQQMPYYQRFSVADGCKLVWFPIDNSKFEFKKHIHSHLLSANASAGVADDYVGDHATFPGTTHGITLQDPVRLEWAIRFSGLDNLSGSNKLPFRFSQVNIYESIPDENFMDVYNPKKGKSGDPSDSVKLLHKAIKHDGGARAGTLGRVMTHIGTKVMDYGGQFIGSKFGQQVLQKGATLAGGYFGGVQGAMLTQGASNALIKSYRS